MNMREGPIGILPLAYDPINQLIEVTDAMGKKTISEYDLVGRRISVTHPASEKTTFEYDSWNRLMNT